MANDKPKQNTYRIQGRVSKEKYEEYKQLKSDLEEELKLPLLDGQFLVRVLDEWQEQRKNK